MFKYNAYNRNIVGSLGKTLFFASAFVLLILSSCVKRENFEIKCSLKSLPTGTAYLTHVNPMTGEVDTIDYCEIVNGHFSFNGSVECPVMCRVETGSGYKAFDLMVENSEIKVRGTAMMLDALSIYGSESHYSWLRLLESERHCDMDSKTVWIEIVKQRNADPEVDVSDLEIKRDSIMHSIVPIIGKEIARNPSSYGTLYYLYYAYVNQLISLHEADSLLVMFNKSELNNSEYYKFMEDEVSLLDTLHINMAAPDFYLPTNCEDTVSLSMYSNHILYMYFTASWDKSPKQISTDELEYLYGKYHLDGFDVLEVCLDRDRAAWDSYISKAQRSWPVACDFLYWESPVTKRFSVDRIPYGVLIDERGIVVAINPNVQLLNYKLRKNLRFKN